MGGWRGEALPVTLIKELGYKSQERDKLQLEAQEPTSGKRLLQQLRLPLRLWSGWTRWVFMRRNAAPCGLIKKKKKKNHLKGRRVILTYFTSVKWGVEKMTMVFRDINNRDQTDEPTKGAFIPGPLSSASQTWTCVWITGGLAEFGFWFTAGLAGSGRRCPCCEWPGARGKGPRPLGEPGLLHQSPALRTPGALESIPRGYNSFPHPDTKEPK